MGGANAQAKASQNQFNLFCKLSIQKDYRFKNGQFMVDFGYYLGSYWFEDGWK